MKRITRKAALWLCLLLLGLQLSGCGGAGAAFTAENAPSPTVQQEPGQNEEGFADIKLLGDDTKDDTADAPQTASNEEGASAENEVAGDEAESADGSATGASAESETTKAGPELSEEEAYYTPEEVALYLHTYGHLPSNYLTKREAQDLGWSSKEGNLWDVAPGCCIGGDRFGNYEGGLPDKKGRKWYECDVNYEGGYRGGERLLYSNDGLIYYSQDHYNTFSQLY